MGQGHWVAVNVVGLVAALICWHLDEGLTFPPEQGRLADTGFGSHGGHGFT